MLRIVAHVQIQDERQFIACYVDSADTKPTEFEGKKIAEGSSCFEVNTGELYLYSEGSESWVKQ